jgi:hypothetical protein
MKESYYLLHTLDLIYRRPEMYGKYVEHIEAVVKHIFHILNTIHNTDWTYELTNLSLQNVKGADTKFTEKIPIESTSIRELKWGNNENKIRESILNVYFTIWQQMVDMSRSFYTSQWIEYLLTDPPILRSPNETDLVLNVLYRVSLQENYRAFSELYAKKVIKLRGSASIGLYDWNIQQNELQIDSLDKEESFEDIKDTTLKIIQMFR